MSGLRDVVFLIVWLGLIPVSLLRPWLGVLAWYWIAFMVPQGLTWGFGRTLPVAIGIGGATLLGLIFTRDRKPIPRTLTFFALLAFTAHITLTTMLAHNPEMAWGKWDWVTKVLLMTFVTMTLFQDASAALALHGHGARPGLLRTQGRHLGASHGRRRARVRPRHELLWRQQYAGAGALHDPAHAPVPWRARNPALG